MKNVVRFVCFGIMLPVLASDTIKFDEYGGTGTLSYRDDRGSERRFNTDVGWIRFEKDSYVWPYGPNVKPSRGYYEIERANSPF